MKNYIGVKQILAEPMNLGDYNKFKGWTIPENEDPNKEGYKVVYSNDYVSWSPKDAFEEAYKETSGLTFGLAVEAAKKGMKIARKGWNGSNMFAYIVPANSYKAVTAIAKEYWGENLVPYRAYWALKTAQEDVATWTPSGSDTLAEDWFIL
jgi:hypothetical protein